MTTKKDSNPKRAMAVKKVSMHVVPVKPLLEVALALTEGGHKYGTHNYRDIGVRSSTYYAASLRHLFAYWEGEDIDPESGVHHVIKAIASMFVLRDSQHMGNCTDDRPIRYPKGIQMSEFNKIAEILLKMYPESATPFLETTHGVPKITPELKQGCDACTLTDSRPPHCAKECKKSIDELCGAPAGTFKDRFDAAEPGAAVPLNEPDQNHTERRSNKDIPEVMGELIEPNTDRAGQKMGEVPKYSALAMGTPVKIVLQKSCRAAGVMYRCRQNDYMGVYKEPYMTGSKLHTILLADATKVNLYEGEFEAI
jgi:hypothetical protein